MTFREFFLFRNGVAYPRLGEAAPGGSDGWPAMIKNTLWDYVDHIAMQAPPNFWGEVINELVDKIDGTADDGLGYHGPKARDR